MENIIKNSNKRSIMLVTVILLAIGGLIYVSSCNRAATTENTATEVDSVVSTPTTATVSATDSTSTADSTKSAK